jgi:hypothetical protein
MNQDSDWKRPAILSILAVIGISGVIEAWPHASESLSDIAIDGAILAVVLIASVLLARRFRSKAK